MSPREIHPDLPPALEAIILKAMAVDPVENPGYSGRNEPRDQAPARREAAIAMHEIVVPANGRGPMIGP